MDTIIVRLAQPTDAPHIAKYLLVAGEELWRQLCGGNLTTMYDLFVDMAEREGTQYSFEHTVIAEVAGKVVGMCNGYDGGTLHALRKPFLDEIEGRFGTIAVEFSDETEAGEFYLDSIGVSDGCRGMGIGQKLLAAMIQYAKEQGFDRVGLLVNEHNPNARRLYERLGFEEIGEKVFINEKMVHLQLEL